MENLQNITKYVKVRKVEEIAFKDSIEALKGKAPKAINWAIIFNTLLKMAVKVHVYSHIILSIKSLKLAAEF